MKEIRFVRIVNRTRYDTAKAKLLASDCYWDGHNWERHGTNRWLYRTPKGNYFITTRTQWQGCQDYLEPITVDQAVELFEGPLSEHYIKYSEAFPDVEILEA